MVCWVDPPVAVGYTFMSDPGSLSFESVSVPAALPGGDGDFFVEVDGMSFPLQAGFEFDFTTAGYPSGVDTFRITGIDPAEALPTDSPTAFVTGLTWLGLLDGEVSFTMVPIVVDADDDDGDGVINGEDNCRRLRR